MERNPLRLEAILHRNERVAVRAAARDGGVCAPLPLVDVVHWVKAVAEIVKVKLGCRVAQILHMLPAGHAA